MKSVTDIFAGQYSGQTKPQDKAIGLLFRSDSPSPVLLSVVIATYNRPDMLERCLEGFKQQKLDHSKFEIIIVDDGSNSRSDELVRRYGNDMPVRYIYQQNAGPAAARNTGIAAAKGNVIVPFDDDSRPHPDCLTRHYGFHLTNPSVEDAMLGLIEWAPGLEITPLMHYVPEVDPRLWCCKNIEQGQLLPFGCLLVGCSSYKKELIQKAGGFNPDCRFGCEDVEAEFRMRQHGLRVHFDRYAISCVSGPVDYEEFCNRSYRQGKALWRLKRLYPSSRPIQQYTNIGNPHDAISKYRNIASRVDSIKKMLSKGWSLPPTGAEPPTLDLLYRCLYASFEYWKNKGFLDEMQFVNRFYSPEAVGANLENALFRKFSRAPERNLVKQRPIECPATESMDAAIGTGIKPQSSLPLVSVIIPTYNRPDQLVDAIRSVQGQTWENIEIIVVNDCGTEVGDIVASMNEKKNITYCRHVVNSGLAAARNTAIKLSKGLYIAYLDDDDIFYPNHVETLVSFLMNSGYKVAYTNAVRAYQVRQNGKYVTTRKELAYTNEFDNDIILLTNLIPVLSVMHEKSCIDDVGPFDEALTTLEDWELWMRMSRKYEFVHIPEITAEVTWRTDGTTMTSSKRPDFLRTHKMIFEKHWGLAIDKPNVLAARQRALQKIELEISKLGKAPLAASVAPAAEGCGDRIY